jgi:hypothetical protein
MQRGYAFFLYVPLRCFAVALCCALTLGGCATESVIDPQMDFRHMPPDQVLALLQPQTAAKIRVPISNSHDNFAKACNGDDEDYGMSREYRCLTSAWHVGDVTTLDDAGIRTAVGFLLRGCGVYARSPETAEGGRTCAELGKFLFTIGNHDAAVAVWESAPGCYSYGAEQVRIDNCFYVASTILARSDPALLRIAKIPCQLAHER